jgi:hypothetical protein
MGHFKIELKNKICESFSECGIFPTKEEKENFSMIILSVTWDQTHGSNWHSNRPIYIRMNSSRLVFKFQFDDSDW